MRERRTFPQSLGALSRLAKISALLALLGCGSAEERRAVVTFPASAVGREADILRRQLDRFQEQHPDIRVELRQTPDASDQRHQLYVQWLNAHASDPDVLQLDAVWTAEFAAAEWILPLDHFQPQSALTAGRARSTLCRGSWTWGCSTTAPT